jgi:hypothetical protein
MRGFSEVRRESCNKRFFGLLGIPMGMCSAYRLATATPGLIFAVRHVSVQNTPSVLGFSEGDEDAGELPGSVSYETLLFWSLAR